MCANSPGFHLLAWISLMLPTDVFHWSILGFLGSVFTILPECWSPCSECCHWIMMLPLDCDVHVATGSWCTCHHQITMLPPDHNVATWSQYCHWIMILPLDHNVTTGSQCCHQIMILPPDHDIATRSWCHHQIMMLPLDHNVTTRSQYHHNPWYSQLANKAELYNLTPGFSLHDNYYMHKSPSLVCAQISHASLDVLHATPPQMHAVGPQLDYLVVISLFYPNVSHPI